MGYKADHPVLERARNRILAMGGATACNTFTKIYLCFLGQYGRSEWVVMASTTRLTAVAGFLALTVAGTAQAALYVYQLPDGSRVVTDHALNNRQYRLIRVGDTPKEIGRRLGPRKENQAVGAGHRS